MATRDNNEILRLEDPSMDALAPFQPWKGPCRRSLEPVIRPHLLADCPIGVFEGLAHLSEDFGVFDVQAGMWESTNSAYCALLPDAFGPREQG